MKALIVGNANPQIDNIAAAQLDPFFKNRKQLQRKLGLTFQHVQAVTLAEIENACKGIDADVEVLFIRPSWREEPTRVEQVFKAIREANRDRKIFFIDPWDQVSSRFFAVLPYVDLMLKYQRLKDVQQYHQPWIGGTVITDYLVREWGYDIEDWHVGSEVPAGYEHRIATAWSVANARRFERILFNPLLWKLQFRRFGRNPKDIDVFCHVSYGSIGDKNNWYTDYRKASVDAVRRLGSKFRLAVSGEYPEARTVSSRQYYDEIERSRIVVSPFGWGELTWRDYEAICNNSLLFKPDVSHIATAPDIFIAGETYVPIKWDYSDLEEKCEYYLQNPDEAARIITRARRRLENYFKQGEFVKEIGALIAGEPAQVPVSAKPNRSLVTSPGA